MTPNPQALSRANLSLIEWTGSLKLLLEGKADLHTTYTHTYLSMIETKFTTRIHFRPALSAKTPNGMVRKMAAKGAPSVKPTAHARGRAFTWQAVQKAHPAAKPC